VVAYGAERRRQEEGARAGGAEEDGKETVGSAVHGDEVKGAGDMAEISVGWEFFIPRLAFHFTVWVRGTTSPTGHGQRAL
jgi:hypothetical protein